MHLLSVESGFYVPKLTLNVCLKHYRSRRLPHQLSVAFMFALNSISLYCKGLSLTYRLVIVRLLFVALNYMN